MAGDIHANLVHDCDGVRVGRLASERTKASGDDVGIRQCLLEKPLRHRTPADIADADHEYSLDHLTAFAVDVKKLPLGSNWLITRLHRTTPAAST
ncbi:hypothetical protein D9M68_940060 [compost metagenome]